MRWEDKEDEKRERRGVQEGRERKVEEEGEERQC